MTWVYSSVNRAGSGSPSGWPPPPFLCGAEFAGGAAMAWIGWGEGAPTFWHSGCLLTYYLQLNQGTMQEKQTATLLWHLPTEPPPLSHPPHLFWGQFHLSAGANHLTAIARHPQCSLGSWASWYIMPFKKQKERKRASKRREQPCISRWNEAAGLRQMWITQSSSFATVTTQRLAAPRPRETGPSGGTCCWFPRSRLAVPGNAAQNRRMENPVHRAPGLAKAPCVNTRCPQLRADEPWSSGVKPTPAMWTLPMYPGSRSGDRGHLLLSGWTLRQVLARELRAEVGLSLIRPFCRAIWEYNVFLLLEAILPSSSFLMFPKWRCKLKNK